MTASKQAKLMGLKNLEQVTQLTNKSSQTLRNWFIDQPVLYEVVLLGCVAKLNKGLDKYENELLWDVYMMLASDDMNKDESMLYKLDKHFEKFVKTNTNK